MFRHLCVFYWCGFLGHPVYLDISPQLDPPRPLPASSVSRPVRHNPLRRLQALHQASHCPTGGFKHDL